MEEKFRKKIIGKGVAQQMINKYKEKARFVLDDKFPFLKRDTMSVWVSKDNILKFFEGDNSKADGLRIYFGISGNYKHEGEDDINCNPEYINQTNLIFVPTLSKISGNPTMRNSDNYIDKNPQAIVIASGGGFIEDDFDLCPPETDTIKCPVIEIQ